MAEKKDGAGRYGGALTMMTDVLVLQRSVAVDVKTHGEIEAGARSLTALVRLCTMVTDLMAKEDNMSMNEHGGDEARMARADDLRAEIERRLARIRADLETKSVAEEADAGAD